MELGIINKIEMTQEGKAESILYFKDNIDVFLDKYDSDFWKPEYDNLLWDFINDNTKIMMCIWCEET
jgi:hypothetical protein